MNKIAGIFICLVLIFSFCKKEILVFDYEPNDDLELPLILNFNNKPCFLDIDTKIFKFPLNENAVNDFSAYVEFQDYSQVFFNSTELKNHAVNYLGDIQLNKPYSITIISHDESADFTFYFTSLPLAQIITLDKIKNEPKVFGRLIVNYTELKKVSENTLIGIEYRGASSGKMEKKSYGFELLNSFNLDDVKKKSLFDMRINNKWALDGMVIDSARMRNRTSLNIWKNLPGENHLGSETEYVEVFHNYKSLGLYSLTEIYTEELLDLNDESVLIVGKENTDATQFYDLPGDVFQNTFWNRWEQKFPDPDVHLNWSSFEDLCKLVVEDNDTEFGNRIYDMIDEENLIDYFLFINVCYGYDNLGKNWYFMKRNPTEKFMIIPWDMDATWGRRHTGNRVAFDKIASNGLFDRLLKVNPDNFRQKIKFRWNELKDDDLSEENILRSFDKNFDILAQHAIIECENTIWNVNLNLIDEQNFIHIWVNHRLLFFNSYIENL